MAQLDHFIYAARDLDPMREAFASWSGMEPAIGGRHPGLGTHNALVSLGESTYFELMAADPQGAEDGYLMAQVKAIETPRLFGYMVNPGHDLESIRDKLAGHAIDSDLFSASRSKPDGTVLRWRLLMPHATAWGGLVPNFIDWLDTPHPARSTPEGCRFLGFRMGHPDAAALNTLLHDAGVDLVAARADRPFMHLEIDTPNGPLLLTGP